VPCCLDRALLPPNALRGAHAGRPGQKARARARARLFDHMN